MSLNSCWQFVKILSLSSNNRICSFYWIRGSKHCFLTSFSNLYCYFLCLIFLHGRYLLVSLHLSWLRGNSISHPVFSYLWFSEYHVVNAPPYFWHTSRVFSNQDACGNMVQELVPAFFPRSTFCRRFLMQTSIGSLWFIPFLLMPNSTYWHFLGWHKPMLSQCSIAQERNPQGISKVVNQGWLLLVWQQLLDNFQSIFALDRVPVDSMHFVQFNSVDLPCYKILCSEFLNVPLPFGMRLKVSPEGRHIFNWL